MKRTSVLEDVPTFASNSASPIRCAHCMKLEKECFDNHVPWEEVESYKEECLRLRELCAKAYDALNACAPSWLPSGIRDLRRITLAELAAVKKQSPTPSLTEDKK